MQTERNKKQKKRYVDMMPKYIQGLTMQVFLTWKMNWIQSKSEN